MKRLKLYTPIISLLFCQLIAKAQPIIDMDDTTGYSARHSTSLSYEFGKGVQMNLNNGAYTFNIGGFIRPFAQVAQNNIPDSTHTVNNFGLGGARLYFTGSAVQEKLSFRLDFDLTSPSALREAWIAYQPQSFIKVTIGQKLVFSNNREYYAEENNLQFTNRSALSNYFTVDGRELGIFVETKFNLGQVQVKPAAAVTTGDGPNSFGANSSDPDAGGLKYSGRLDVLPFGAFTNNGDYYGADLAREKKPKLAIGMAISRNMGASGPTGEAHNAFTLYNTDGTTALANYDKVFADLIFKYRGFSILGEFANSRVVTDQRLFLDAGAGTAFMNNAIAERYIVGSAYNVQTGYILKSNWSIDLRYTSITPEFNGATSLLPQQTWYTIGTTKYIRGQAMKIGADYSYMQQTTSGTTNNTSIVRVLAQLVF